MKTLSVPSRYHKSNIDNNNSSNNNNDDGGGVYHE